MQQQYLKAVMLYCVKQDDNIAGFIGVLENKVEMLFIHPLYRGQGLGKKLMQFGINQLGITRVDVNEQNNQAVDFYKYLGFKVVGRQVVDGLGKPYPILNMQL